jgi:hypothetical protein
MRESGYRLVVNEFNLLPTQDIPGCAEQTACMSY